MRKIEFPSCTVYDNATIRAKKELTRGSVVAELRIGKKLFGPIEIGSTPGRRNIPPNMVVPIRIYDKKRWEAFWKAYNQ